MTFNLNLGPVSYRIDINRKRALIIKGRGHGAWIHRNYRWPWAA